MDAVRRYECKHGMKSGKDCEVESTAREYLRYYWPGMADYDAHVVGQQYMRGATERYARSYGWTPDWTPAVMLERQRRERERRERQARRRAKREKIVNGAVLFTSIACFVACLTILLFWIAGAVLR